MDAASLRGSYPPLVTPFRDGAVDHDAFAKLVVEKAGAVIPYIVRSEPEARTGQEVPFVFPTECPACGSPVVKDQGGPFYRCTGSDCLGQLRKRIQSFARRSVMDIEGLGDKLADQLVDTGLVRSLPDLYRLTADKLKELERMGELSTQNLLSAADGSPVVSPTHDMVLGCYYLTIEDEHAAGAGKIFTSFDEAQMALDADIIHLQAPISVAPGGGSVPGSPRRGGGGGDFNCSTRTARGMTPGRHDGRTRPGGARSSLLTMPGLGLTWMYSTMGRASATRGSAGGYSSTTWRTMT